MLENSTKLQAALEVGFELVPGITDEHLWSAKVAHPGLREEQMMDGFDGQEDGIEYPCLASLSHHM